MGYRNRNTRGSAFATDAATGASLAFLSSQLEFATPKLIKPLTSMTHARDITVKTGGGFVEYISAYAADYTSVGGNQYGLQGNNNTDIPEVGASLNKGLWHAWNWASGYTITAIDLKKLETAHRNGLPAPFSLQKNLDDAVRLVWNKALEYVTYLGWLGQPGLVNNPNVVSSVASNPWSTATPVQIQTEINTVLQNTVSQSAYSLDGMADTILIPWSSYSYLMAPMTTGGFSSILEFLLNNNIARQNGINLKIFPLANPWIATAGVGGTTRAVAYRNNEETLELRVPQPVTKVFTIPTADKGGAYQTIFNGCIGQVLFYRTQAAYYLDTI